MMRASQGKTKPPFDKGKQKNVVPVSASLEEDYQKRNISGATNGGSSSKLKSRMRPREKPRVEPVLKLSVPLEPDPGTDGHEISEQVGGDHESVMGHEMLDSTPLVEKPSLPVAKPQSVEKSSMPITEPPLVEKSSLPVIEPPPVTEAPQQRESEGGVTDSQFDFRPTEHISPFTSQDISEKALAESAQDVELQEEAHLEAHLPTESTQIACDQPAESSSTDAGEASQITEAVVPVPKASSRRGARSGQKKLSTIPVGRMTRSAASKLKTTELSVARSG